MRKFPGFRCNNRMVALDHAQFRSIGPIAAGPAFATSPAGKPTAPPYRRAFMLIRKPIPAGC
jgi:hypothetical protein